MPYTESDGVKIFYVKHGDGDETIFFVHGLGESHETWKEQLTFFPNKGYKTIAIDLRGHGKSEIPKKRIEIEDFANDVLSVIKSEGLSKVHFCGYSMGALVLFELYEKNPEYFKSFVVEAAVPQYPPAQTSLLENMSMDEIARQVADFAVSPEAPDELKDDIYKIISKTDKEIYIESAEAACSKDYRDLLPKIKVPTLIISGEIDYISPPEAADSMGKLISNSKVVIFEKTGHMPHRENPKKFNETLLSFFKHLKGVTSEK